MKQETCGAGGVYLSSGREKSGFRRVDFDFLSKSNIQKVAMKSYMDHNGYFKITRYRV